MRELLHWRVNAAPFLRLQYPLSAAMRPRAVSLTSSESAFVFSFDFLQVSPDLYGDNNTRLFTYWTVSFVCSFQYEFKPKKWVKCACIDV